MPAAAGRETHFRYQCEMRKLLHFPCNIPLDPTLPVVSALLIVAHLEEDSPVDEDDEADVVGPVMVRGNFFLDPNPNVSKIRKPDSGSVKHYTSYLWCLPTLPQ